MDKYYQILGLKPGARKEEIKRAYRRLAKKYHPDVNPKGEQKFLLIREAYEYLLAVKSAQFTQHRQAPRNDMEAFREKLKKEAERKAREELQRKAERFRQRKAEKQNLEYRRGVFILVAIVALFFTVRTCYRWYFKSMVTTNHVQTYARVTAIGYNRVTYAFADAEGNEVLDKEYVSNNGIEMLADNGMPLKIGDIFLLDFNAADPSYHLIDYERIHRKTLDRYLKLTEVSLLKHLDREGLKMSPKIYARCVALLVFQKEGLEGLAKIHHAETNPLEYVSYNKWTWAFFKKSDAFQDILATCNP